MQISVLTRKELVSFRQEEAQPLQAELEILDLNRMRFGKVSVERGCANFDRFHINEEALKVMVTAYAQARGTDTETCIEKALYYHRLSHPQA